MDRNITIGKVMVIGFNPHRLKALQRGSSPSLQTYDLCENFVVVIGYNVVQMVEVSNLVMWIQNAEMRTLSKLLRVL